MFRRQREREGTKEEEEEAGEDEPHNWKNDNVGRLYDICTLLLNNSFTAVPSGDYDSL
jgi:hypothetical protein